MLIVSDRFRILFELFSDLFRSFLNRFESFSDGFGSISDRFRTTLFLFKQKKQISIGLARLLGLGRAGGLLSRPRIVVRNSRTRFYAGLRSLRTPSAPF